MPTDWIRAVACDGRVYPSRYLGIKAVEIGQAVIDLAARPFDRAEFRFVFPNVMGATWDIPACQCRY